MLDIHHVQDELLPRKRLQKPATAEPELDVSRKKKSESENVNKSHVGSISVKSVKIPLNILENELQVYFSGPSDSPLYTQ